MLEQSDRVAQDEAVKDGGRGGGSGSGSGVRYCESPDVTIRIMYLLPLIARVYGPPQIVRARTCGSRAWRRVDCGEGTQGEKKKRNNQPRGESPWPSAHGGGMNVGQPRQIESRPPCDAKTVR